MVDRDPPNVDPEVSADCARCFGLCCTALSFQRGGQFGHDKLAGEPCHYLAADFGCRIHSRREELGYEGCIEFDCLGAGQRASAAFAADNWRRDAGAARRMHAHFAQLLRLQEMRRALIDAKALSLPPVLEARRESALASIADLADSAAEADASQVEAALDGANGVLDAVEPFLAQASFS